MHPRTLRQRCTDRVTGLAILIFLLGVAVGAARSNLVAGALALVAAVAIYVGREQIAEIHDDEARP